jgi:hypothetical protein
MEVRSNALPMPLTRFSLTTLTAGIQLHVDDYMLFRSRQQGAVVDGWVGVEDGEGGSGVLGVAAVAGNGVGTQV